MMQTLCVVDTCSLVYLSNLRLAGKSLHNWLWTEFHVTYSNAVWEEINRHLHKMGKDAKKLQKNGHKSIWTNCSLAHYERILFTQSSIPFGYARYAGACERCNQPIYRPQKLQIDITMSEDKGERHNCCVALDALNSGRYQNIIFLTDDFRARDRFVKPIFDSIPLGSIWSSHDFVVFLFLRHRDRITRDDIGDVLRDLTANISDQPAETLAKRLRIANEKVDRVAKVSEQL